MKNIIISNCQNCGQENRIEVTGEKIGNMIISKKTEYQCNFCGKKNIIIKS